MRKDTRNTAYEAVTKSQSRRQCAVGSPTPFPARSNWVTSAATDLPFLLQHFSEALLLVLQQALEMLHFLLVLSSFPGKFLLLLSHFETDISKLPSCLLFIYLQELKKIGET